MNNGPGVEVADDPGRSHAVNDGLPGFVSMRAGGVARTFAGRVRTAARDRSPIPAVNASTRGGATRSARCDADASRGSPSGPADSAANVAIVSAPAATPDRANAAPLARSPARGFFGALIAASAASGMGLTSVLMSTRSICTVIGFGASSTFETKVSPVHVSMTLAPGLTCAGSTVHVASGARPNTGARSRSAVTSVPVPLAPVRTVTRNALDDVRDAGRPEVEVPAGHRRGQRDGRATIDPVRGRTGLHDERKLGSDVPRSLVGSVVAFAFLAARVAEPAAGRRRLLPRGDRGGDHVAVVVAGSQVLVAENGEGQEVARVRRFPTARTGS